ncbi:MAG: replication-associated recombination protein A [Actinobacteria bacterium]|nr:MAG: replication-associated recombination protein A [Actinomycetota bacterium]
MDDLFEASYIDKLEKIKPLATRLRPRNLSGFIGQEHLIGQGTALRKAIEDDNLLSVVFYGPPGTGKTTLAKIVSSATSSYFAEVSAVNSTVSDLRKAIKEAKDRLKLSNQKTVLFIDEIHRFSKSQQDALLPAVENGLIILIGATTENPYFEVNSPLISRSRICELKPLSNKQIEIILNNAYKNDSLISKKKIEIEDQALKHLVSKANGDARFALNALEYCVNSSSAKNGKHIITLQNAIDCTQKKALRYDKKGDMHYDTISAFTKSMRASDADAAICWLARMIEGGEDPKFIARRMVIFASEDIGNADPQALVVAMAAASAVDYVGLPEARLNLAQAAIYLAKAKKSNDVIKAIDSALADVRNKPDLEVPEHLRSR